MTILSVKAIRKGFPHQTLPPLTDSLSYAYIKRIHELLKDNAASVRTNLGGGQLGYLGLVLRPQTYFQISGVPLQQPVFPGEGPDLITGNPNGPEVQRRQTQFDIDEKRYYSYRNTDTALKQQLLEAIPDMYFRQIRNVNVGYANTSTWQLLNHLYTNYAIINISDLSDNTKRMNQPWDATQPFETLIKQIMDAQEVATLANSPFSEPQLVNTGLLLIEPHDSFERAYNNWLDRPTAEHTWDNFKRHFTDASHRIRAHPSRARTGAHLANQAVEFHRETTEAINELANATVEDREQITLLSQANVTLAQSNNSLRIQLENIQSQMDKLLSTITNDPASTGNRGTNGGGRGRGRSGRGRTNSNNGQSRGGYEPGSSYYCWTHGKTCNRNHTSSSCRTKREGHQDNATLEDRMNGSNINCE